MEPGDILDAATQEDNGGHRLNAAVAVSVAILATFMGICNVKDGNIMQAMQQAQADKIDNYGWYQAKKTRLEFMTADAENLHVEAPFKPAAERQALDALAKKTEDEISAKTKELDDVKKKADDADKSYDAWNAHDDQFDLSEGAISIAIALLAVTALTKKKWLFFAAMIPAVTGVLFGIAGFAGWDLRIDWLMKFLGT